MKRVKINHVNVDPSACDAWSGAFIKNPSRADIIDAIRYDHSQLDPDIEHEYDRRDNLVLCLQLLDQVGIIIYGLIKIAGSYVGSITTNESEAFVRVTAGSVTEVRDVEMEQRCVEAHEAGESRPLQEFIDALQAESEGFGDQFFNVLKNTVWEPKV